MLINVVLPLVGTLLVPWLGLAAGKWINANVRNTYLQNVLLRVDDLALTVVKEVQQTMDGASGDQKKTAALETLRSHLGPKGLAEVMHVLGLDDGGLQSFLTSKLEANVHDVKQQLAA
jgi:hypothetical protein